MRILVTKLIGKTLDLPGLLWLEPENTGVRGANALLHCSLITAKGAESLLKFMWPVNHTDCIDVYMRKNFDKFRAYFYTGDLIKQRPVRSDREEPLPKRRRMGSSSSTQQVQSNRLCLQHLSLNPINKKERIFWKIVNSDKLFEGLSAALKILQDARSVAVVGNGPMTGRLGSQIDRSPAAIIRCNDYATATRADEHGARCDLHLRLQDCQEINRADLGMDTGPAGPGDSVGTRRTSGDNCTISRGRSKEKPQNEHCLGRCK